MIQDYTTVELDQPIKTEKQTRPYSIRVNDVLLPHVQAVEDISTSSQDFVSLSSVLSHSSDTFGDDFSYLLTEFESKYISSVNHHFVNDFEVSNNCISQIDTEANFALALNLSRSTRLSRNGEDIIIIHKKKRAPKTERLMTIFTALK